MGLTVVNPRRKRRRRRAFSLNGLAIQLSALALSFTLVALLVVSGSQAAFVEENEIVTKHVPLGLPPEESDGGPPWTPGPRTPAAATPTPTPAPVPTAVPTVVPAVEEPVPVPEPPAPSIALTDSDAGTAMFSSTTVLVPGAALDRCITVTYDGELDPSPVRLYAAEVSGELPPYLDLTVELGSEAADGFGSCASFAAEETLFQGTLRSFAAAHASYAGGVPTWDPAATGESRSFRFRIAVEDVPAAEGKTAGFGFTWEARDA